MNQLFIVIMLLIVFAGLIAFLIYSLISYRKRNIIKFLILVCMASGCEVVIAQSENITNIMEIDTGFDLESEPTFELSDSNYPGPIVLPELHKAGDLIEVSIYGMTDYYNSDFNETELEKRWLAMMSDINNISSNNTSSNLTIIA